MLAALILSAPALATDITADAEAPFRSWMGATSVVPLKGPGELHGQLGVRIGPRRVHAVLDGDVRLAVLRFDGASTFAGAGLWSDRYDVRMGVVLDRQFVPDGPDELSVGARTHVSMLDSRVMPYLGSDTMWTLSDQGPVSHTTLRMGAGIPLAERACSFVSGLEVHGWSDLPAVEARVGLTCAGSSIRER